MPHIPLNFRPKPGTPVEPGSIAPSVDPKPDPPKKPKPAAKPREEELPTSPRQRSFRLLRIKGERVSLRPRISMNRWTVAPKYVYDLLGD